MDKAFEHSAEDQAFLERILAVLAIWEPYHERWVERANHFYGLYRNVQNWTRQLRESSPRGLDDVVRDGQSVFGPELFIPMCFATVETIIPAMLASPPDMGNITARNQASENNVANVRAMIEAQHEAMNYELRLQTIAKDGLIYGTGVQKTYWKTDHRKRRRLIPSAEPAAGMVPVELLDTVWDDPDQVAVDPKDFITDPFSQEIAESDGAFHRSWRSNRYVQRKVEAGHWRNLTGAGLSELADSSKFDQLMNERERAVPQAARESRSSTGKQPIHEVLEFHDGEQVVTILDRKVIVYSGPNPNWHGELPFQVFRPTEDTHSIHGIGEIEPIEKLQEELNALRTERRYNAALVLQRVFAYHEGLVEKEDIQFGPGNAIGVNGDPRELIFPIQVGDIPNSGYEEEDRITGDIDRVSGISDTVAGAGLSGGDTATGVQLVQSAASRRIENKTRRLELEVIDPGAQQIVALDQQRILNNREVRIPAQPTPDQPDRRWAWLPIGPLDLMGEFDVRCSRRSTQPENIPQNRADAQMAMTLFAQVPAVEQRKVVEFAARKMGIDQPQSWIAPPNPTVPAAVLDRLREMQVPEAIITKALAEAGGPDLSGGNAPGMVGGDPLPPGSPTPAPQGGPEGEGGESSSGGAPQSEGAAAS
jgi:hypothetical protein